MRLYQRRWFVYENGYLTSYLDRSQVGEVARAQIHLLGCSIRRVGTNGFEITKNKEMQFALRSDNKKEYNIWLEVIAHGIVECNQNAQKEEKSVMESNCQSDTSIGDEFHFLKNNFLTKTSISSESCKQMAIFVKELERQFLVGLHELNSSRSRETASDISNKISTFRDLNKKVCSSIDELVLESKLFAECAAAYRASLNNNFNSKNTMTESQDLNLNANTKSMSKDSLQVDDVSIHASEDEFFDACTELASENSEYSLNTPVSRFNSRSSTELTTRHVVHIRSMSDMIPKKARKFKDHRTEIPLRPNAKISLWSLISNMIGKDLSKVPLPVNFNEPLSMLQRVAESLEYSNLLDAASACDCPRLQMCYVIAFSISNYFSTSFRANKPFNPLLGETFECDRMEELGWRCVCEQVSHHPPVCALHAEGEGWILFETFDVKSKFKAKYLEIQPKGLSQLLFTRTGYRYSWNKVTTYVNNIVLGTLWIDQGGEFTVNNHSTGDIATVKFYPYTMFRSCDHKKVIGTVKDKDDQSRYSINGYWDKFIECSKLASKSASEEVIINKKMLWTPTPLPIGAEKMYHFSTFTCSLNDPDPMVAPTDSRWRPDQRVMENGNFDLANKIKVQLEDSQRIRRKKILDEAINSGEATSETTIEEIQKPLWFKIDPTITHAACPIYAYKGGYWEAKLKGDFSMCPKLFDI
ncbi:hypothetical protein MXB_5034 [Myxobolus squamalis]|nr:hypothetical protein MXB_5034 [Myxobolus squamalis]